MLDEKYRRRAKRSKRRASEKLTRELAVRLAGHDPHTVGFVLADLVGMWLSGFKDAENPREVSGDLEGFREKALEAFTAAALALAEMYDGEFREAGMKQ